MSLMESSFILAVILLIIAGVIKSEEKREKKVKYGRKNRKKHN